MTTRLAPVVLAALFFIPGAARAAGYTTVDRSVVALGAGGTGAARAEDPAANVYNPAAATSDPGFVVSTGLLVAAPTLTAEGAGWSASTRAAPTLPPSLHVRYGGERFAAGASLTVPFGSTLAWGEWPGRFEVIEARLRVVRASAFGGVRFGRVALAVGPFFDLGTLDLEKALDFVDVEGRIRLETRARGYGLVAAVFARPLDALALGLTYTSRSRLDFEGRADFTTPVEFAGRAADQALSTQLRLPDRFTFGVSWAVVPALDVAFDLDLFLWGSVDRLVLDFAASATDDVVQPRAWKATVTPRAGVTWRPALVAGLALRAGAFFDPSPVPAATVGPSSPDSSRVGLSIGAGYALFERTTLDVGYQLALFAGARSEAETLGLEGVRYGGRVHLFGAAFTHRL